MRVVFMGTPDFAVSSLKNLLKDAYEVAAVVTQPDRPKGRGNKIQISPVKEAAVKAGLKVYQPDKVRDPAFINTLTSLNPDIIVVAAFGQLLPPAILSLPHYGCVNVHASLLPAYRGAAPIHRAVINGEQETGVTIMQMDKGLDTGDILLQEQITIGPEDTVGYIHDRLAELGARLLTKALNLIRQGLIYPEPQQESKSTYATMLTKKDELICWPMDALAVKNQIRGLNPWPGAHTYINDKLLKIWRVSIVDYIGHKEAVPGQLLECSPEKGILVQTGSGVVSIDELQLQGKKTMEAGDFLRGRNLASRTILGEK